ncbi:MAG: DUF817 domain-containing protein [Planctomycetes bacterium]|nr:DUF817 domain-containing protein [Planctomycetota bacterium]
MEAHRRPLDRDPPLIPLLAVAERLPPVLRLHAGDPAWLAFLREFVAFGWKHALACVFPVFIFAMLGASQVIHIPGLYRYDVILLGCLALQAAMWWSRLETTDEVKVIAVFHLLGLAMELHKVRVGSWSYPEPAWSKVGGVPLYSGFMYASVASFMCQAWRRFDLQMVRWPPAWAAGAIGVGIYCNFFTNRWLPDVRWWLFAGMAVVFWRAHVEFTPNGPRRRMPVIVAFFLIAFFIWLAENIATFLNAWKYPHQHLGWAAVKLQKLTSWSLLVIVTMILVAGLKRVKAARATGDTSAPRPIGS